MKRYDLTKILASGYHTTLDLGTDGDFEVEEIEIVDGRADVHGVHIVDGHSEPATLTIYSVHDRTSGEIREVRDLADVFEAGWEDWDV